jgi:hypothetical protein
MDLRIKLLASAAVALFVFLGGYYVKDKIDEAAQADLLRQQIKAQVEQQDALTAKAAATEAERDAWRQRFGNLNRKWSVIRAQEPDTCPLGDSRIGLLRDATAPLGEAAR